MILVTQGFGQESSSTPSPEILDVTLQPLPDPPPAPQG